MSEGVISGICAPALVYLSFSLVQIVIDIYKSQFYTAFFKFWTMLLITTILNILCERGLEAISWIFVFVPIITMTILLVVLIYFLGFNPGQINKKFNVNNIQQKQQHDAKMTNSNIAEIVRREIAIQKQLNSQLDDSVPGVDEIIKIDESFSVKKNTLFNPSDFLN